MYGDKTRLARSAQPLTTRKFLPLRSPGFARSYDILCRSRSGLGIAPKNREIFDSSPSDPRWSGYADWLGLHHAPVVKSRRRIWVSSTA